MSTATVTSTLRVWDENRPETTVVETTDRARIAEELAKINVRFERWNANADLAADADQATVIAAYHDDIERLKREGGYTTVDVLGLAKGTPNVEPIRQKFLSEHTHTEDEVRFFVKGSAAFYLRAQGRVHQVVCVKDDLISVPAGTTHWFDMGPDPEFAAIRLFQKTEGWTPAYTGDPIAQRFPLYE